MKKFFKDYMELQRHSNKWIKDHWKGYILFTVLVGVVYCVGWRLIFKTDTKKVVTNSEDSTEEEA